MRLSILCAGMFAVLSLVAPAWAETGASSSAEPGANCDVAKAPDYLFTTAKDKLSKVAPEVDPDVEGDIFAGMSESEVYQRYYKTCYFDYVRAARDAAKADSAYPQERFVAAYVGNILALTSRQPIAPGSAWEAMLTGAVAFGPGGLDARYPGLSALRDKFGDVYRTGGLTALRELAQNYQDAAGFADGGGALDEASVREACIGADPKEQSQSLRDYSAGRVLSAGADIRVPGNPEGEILSQYGVPLQTNSYQYRDSNGTFVGILSTDSIMEDPILDKNGPYSKAARDLSKPKLYEMAENCSAAVDAFVGGLEADGSSDDEVNAKIASLFRDILKSYSTNGKSGDIVLKAMYGNMLHVVASRAQGPKLVSQLNGLLYLFERGMSVLPKTPSPT